MADVHVDRDQIFGATPPSDSPVEFLTEVKVVDDPHA
jgi:hypothetical protein